MRRVQTWTSMGGTAVAIHKRDYRLMCAVLRAVERRIKIGSYEVELEMEAAYRAFDKGARKP